MSKRVGGWARGRVLGWMAVAALGACSADGATSPRGAGEDVTEGAASEPAGEPRVSGADGEVRYQIVEAADGVSMEAVTPTAVHTFSCPRSCSGVCNECAVSACRAAGDLPEVCAAMVRECNDSCACGEAFSPSSCGFPVCATNRNLCYIGPDAVPALTPPADPDPDPRPLTPAAGVSRPPSAGAPSGAGAARPAG